MLRGLFLFIFSLCLVCEGAHAFDCRKIPILLRDFATNLLVDPEVKKLLEINHIKILRWKGSVAVLSASMNGMTGSSSILELCLQNAKPTPSLSLKKIDDKLLAKIGGEIVYAKDRRTGKILFVGIPEGSEEKSEQVLMTADLILKLGLDTRNIIN
ncbi:MAG: hypothetical protein J0L93_03965 [Deltaproteobacteria bacterium]|nr:hypothetical protein [Deltaproteobacteria bacterium]